MIRKCLSFIIVGLRPLFGPAQCRYALGCTQFAIIQLEQKPLLQAVWAITKRLISCNPISQLLAKQ